LRRGGANLTIVDLNIDGLVERGGRGSEAAVA